MKIGHNSLIKKSYLITKEYDGIRLDKFLSIINRSINFNAKNKIIRKGCIKVNNASKKHPSYRLKAQDTVSYYALGVSTNNDNTKNAKPKGFIKNCVVYEDTNIIVLNKPSGISCQKGGKNDRVNINTLLKDIYGEIFLIHRLDKMTTGVLIAAKRRSTARLLSEYLRQNLFIKSYIAIVDGIPQKKAGRICTPIRYDNSGFINPKGKIEKEAKTYYKFFAYNRKIRKSIVYITIQSGRKHQIRYHLSCMKCPILGDFVYNKQTKVKQNLFLHALSIQCKKKGIFVHNTIEATIPKYFNKYIKENFNIEYFEYFLTKRQNQ